MSLATGHGPGRARTFVAAILGLLAAVLAQGATANAFARTWCELDTAEFRLITDRPRDEAEDMARQMHAFRPAAEHYLPGVPNDRNPPLTVVVFGHGADYRRIMHGGERVGFMQPSFTDSLMVVGPDPVAASPYEPLFHEYVHYLLRTRTGIDIPAWLDEGLASMLSTARVDAGELEIGGVPANVLAAAIRESRLSLNEVLHAEDVWDWHRDQRLGFYAWSWLLVHRLMLGQEVEAEDYRPALAALLHSREASLPKALGLSSNALERRLQRYLGRRMPTVHQRVDAAADGTNRYRCLDDAETVRQVSLAIVQHNPTLAAAELTRALEQHPDRADLWTALSLAKDLAGDRQGGLDAARRALKLAPEDDSAAVRLANALSVGCIFHLSEACRNRWREAVPLLRQTLRRNPTRQDAIFTLGLAYLYSGRAGDALNYLRIAHERQPWAPNVNFYLGESYRLIGDSRARQYLTRARRWSPTELWRKLADAGLQRLDASR